MSDRTMQADPSDDALVSAIDGWSAQAGLSELVGRADAAFLVLDADGIRILHASPAARALRAGLARADGSIPRTLNLAGQIGGTGHVAERPRLARLRLDPRGIARPATCLVARAVLGEGATALILAPVGELPVLRPLVTAPVGPSAAGGAAAGEVRPEIAAETGPVAARQDGRVVWRSDESGVVRQVSGDEAVSRALAGRSWPDLFAQGAVAGERLSAAIADRATFRALPAAIAVPDGGGTVEVDLSGAPSARPHQPFGGFSGFGLIRARRPSELLSKAADTPSDAPEADRDADEGEPVAPPAVEAPVSDVLNPAAASASEEPAALSAHEHAAFREIARTLGVRFAGDDDADTRAAAGEADAPDSAISSRGSVTPFPAAPRTVRATGGGVDLLESLPVGALVHRDDAVLFANARLLGLTGFADLAALRDSDAAATLLREARHDREADRAVTVEGASGAPVDLLLDRAGIAWDGAPANLLLARPAPAPPSRKAAPEARAGHEATDAVRAEAARLLDSLPDGVLALDEAGRVLSLNARAAALLARPAQAVVGDAFARMFSLDAEPAVEAALAQAERGGAGEVEVVSRPREDGPVPLSLRVVHVPEGAARFCATMRDRSESAAGEAEIARQTEALAARKADFLAKVGHEIRTPLNTILGFADVMMSEPDGPLGAERYREYLRDIHDSGSHTLRVVDDLLDLARIEAGRVDLSFTDIPLNDLVSGCIALMQPQAARDRIVVRTSFAPDLKTLVADERSMRQAALNVIANAIRFTEAGGQVIVSTMIAERGEIALRVRDTGVGMTTEEVENALRPFDRVGVAGPGPGGGTGLGLTLTKALVEANRGRFRITSRKHEGTLVEMVFPAAEARRA